MKKLALLGLALAAGLVSSQVASAQTYNFTFTGANSGADANVVGYGTLAVAGGLVTSLTGAIDVPIGDPAPNIGPISLLPPNGYAGNDNVFIPSGSPAYFSYSGISFTSNSIDYNLTNLGFSAILDSTTDPVGYGLYPTPITFSVTYVPEGGSSYILALCALGLAGAIFYKGRQSGLFLNS